MAVLFRMKFAHGVSSRGRKAQREIEIAIVHGSIPADVQLMPAHQTLERRWVKRIAKEQLIVDELSSSGQIVQKPADGHVCNRVEFVEVNSEFVMKRAPVGFFQFAFVWWQAWSTGVIDEVKNFARVSTVS